jgi:hypothetical protein
MFALNPKTFNYIPHSFPKLLVEESDRRRVYLTPSGKKYASVTTVTGEHNKAEILAWRKAVGEAKANKTSSESANKGKRVHKILEHYIKNEHKEAEELIREAPPNVRSLFFKMKKELDGKVDNVRCSETPMYSDKLRLAGTVDCVADYKGIPSIIDFKTSNKLKTKEKIGGYFMQGSAYRTMFNEHNNIAVSQVVILIGVDSADFCQTMVIKESELNHYEEMLLGYIDLHYKKYPIEV